MSELVKMEIRGYESSGYTGDFLSFTVQINPAEIKLGKTIDYHASDNGNLKYKGYKSDDLSINIILDDTGVISSTATPTIKQRIANLENVIYDIDSEIHEPRYVQVVWGDIIFKGRLKSASYNYNLFLPNGTPLRVTASLSFSSYMDAATCLKIKNLASPDLSRLITLKAGESIAQWCNKIYGDASYCFDIAKLNNLPSFRNVEPGTSIMFPPLVRNG